jgi:membrane-associated phospholipid phosphatase
MISISFLRASWDSPSFLTNQNATSLKLQQTIGDMGVIALNLFALGLVIQKEDKEGFFEYLYGGATTTAVVLGGKYLIKRERPDGSNNYSMPSGHSAFSFFAASFITNRYGNKYAASTYLTSAFIAYSRVATKKHNVSDVLVGSALGFAIGQIFTTEYKINIDNNRYSMSISPNITKDSFYIKFNFS